MLSTHIPTARLLGQLCRRFRLTRQQTTDPD
jgi:hypothetical protein